MVDECGQDEGCDEVLVLFPEGAEFGGAQVFLVEALAGVLRVSAWSCGVGVLDLDEAVAPAGWQGRCLKVDAIDAEAVEFLERGELPGDCFDQVGEACGFVVVIGDGGGCRLRRTWWLRPATGPRGRYRGWTESRRRLLPAFR